MWEHPMAKVPCDKAIAEDQGRKAHSGGDFANPYWSAMGGTGLTQWVIARV